MTKSVYSVPVSHSDVLLLPQDARHIPSQFPRLNKTLFFFPIGKQYTCSVQYMRTKYSYIYRSCEESMERTARARGLALVACLFFLVCCASTDVVVFAMQNTKIPIAEFLFVARFLLSFFYQGMTRRLSEKRGRPPQLDCLEEEGKQEVRDPLFAWRAGGTAVFSGWAL